INGVIFINIGVIGTGNIAEYLLEEINTKANFPVKIVTGFVRNKEKYSHLKEKYDVEIIEDIKRLLESDIDTVIEATNAAAVKENLSKVIKHKDSIVISIGAFSDETFLKEIHTVARENNHSIYLPSGAIGGLDLIQNAGVTSGIDQVKITTRKPAQVF